MAVEISSRNELRQSQLVGHRRAAIGIQFDLRQILNEFARQKYPTDTQSWRENLAS
jgi:hypothetical protein